MREPLCAKPPTTILPSGCTATFSAPSKEPKKSIVSLPPVPKLASGAPLVPKRATAKPGLIRFELCPATTILPSACTSTARAKSSSMLKAAVASPLLPKPSSMAPLPPRRITAKALLPPIGALPAMTIRPSACKARASPRARLGSVSLPAVPKLLSGLPMAS